MWIGTSLGKCVKDILDGKVKEDQVLFIASNTMCPDLVKLCAVIEEYYYNGHSRGSAYDMTAHSLLAAKEVAQRLYENGQLHQPRCFKTGWSGNAHGLRDTWYEIVPTNTSHDSNVVDAYERYRVLAELMK